MKGGNEMKSFGKSNLISDMLYAYEHGRGYVIMVETPDTPEYEIIINPPANLPSKMKYYEKAYNDDLTLKSNPNIKIVNYYQDL